MVKCAKKAWDDAAGSSSRVAKCPVVERMKGMNEANAEEQMHPVLRKYNLSLPVDLSPISGGLLDQYPRLKPIDFLEYMRESGRLNRLLGGKQVAGARQQLEQFWKNYELCHPDFGLFFEESVDYGLCIPVFAHADGGRGYKKSEFMVFNWSSVIGSGTGQANKKDHSIRQLKKQSDQSQINLLGNSYGTHYMYSVMPAAWHKDDSRFQEMLTQMGKDLFECYEHGVELCGGERLRLVCLGLKADLKLQARAGKFTRWYSTCRKAPQDETKKTQTIGMCCFLCPAGHPQIPFEEIHTEFPTWRQEMAEFAVVPPWNEGDTCGLLTESFLYHSQPAKFFLIDLFHTYLAGFGQDHAASCLVFMLGKIFGGTSVEVQLESLNAAWRHWKRMHHVTTHTYNFTRQLLNFLDGTKTFPTGTWSKASDTAKILTFISDMLDLYDDKVSSDKGLYYIKVSCGSLRESMVSLYMADLWVDPWMKEYKLSFLLKHWYAL